MKRMVYIIIAVTTLLVIGSVAVGCTANPLKNKSDIVGLSLYQGHMVYSQSYSFFLRKEDSKVLFDADVRIEKDGEDFKAVLLERCEVDPKYFDELITFMESNKVYDYVDAFRKKPQIFEAMDKTTNTTTVYFADGSDKSADSGAYKEELREFFTDLALLYKEMSVSVN